MDVNFLSSWTSRVYIAVQYDFGLLEDVGISRRFYDNESFLTFLSLAAFVVDFAGFLLDFCVF